MEYLKSRRSTIRSNIKNRYSNLGISATIPAFESYALKLDTTAPSVALTSPSDDATLIYPEITSISVTFSEVMDTGSITGNNSDTICSGNLQLSGDAFSSCIQFSSSPASSNSDKTFTITPASTLSYSTSYKFRVTTNVKDLAGNQISNQYESTSGFTTWSNASSYNVVLTIIGSGGNVCVEINKWSGCGGGDTTYTAGTHTINVPAGESIGFEINTNAGYSRKFTEPNGNIDTGSAGIHRGPKYDNVRDNKSIQVEFISE